MASIQLVVELQSDGGSVDADSLFLAVDPLVFYFAVNQREQSEVFATTDVAAGVDGLANLTNQDAAGTDLLATLDFDASVLCA